MLTKQFELEQNQGKERMQELNFADDMGKDIRLFIDEIGQYSTITELDQVICASTYSQHCCG